MVRVLHLTEAPLGGVVAYLEEILAAQHRAGMEIALVTPALNLPALAHVGDFPRIAPEVRRGSLRDLARLTAMAVRQTWRMRPDVVHVHSTFAGAAFRLCRPFLPRGTKLVYCPHGWAFSRKGSTAKNRVIALAERVLSLGCDAIICISRGEREEALAAGLPKRKLVVVENGVSPRAPALPKEPRSGPLNIAFVGRFDRQKGFDTWCEVLRRLGPEAKGIAVGQAIVTKGPAPKVPHNAQVIGWQSRDVLARIYREADVLLVPSRWEGFGLVAVEAMQAGTAVFASRVGGLADIVVDGETGRGFAPDDAAGIVEMLRQTDRATLDAYGRAGHARYIQRYTAERMSREIAQLYAHLLGASKANPEPAVF